MIFSVASGGASLGATFIEWSIHYLSGGDLYYSHDLSKEILLPSNPLNGVNAHQFPKNHPSGLLETVKCFENLSASTLDVLSFFPVMTKSSDFFNIEKPTQELLDEYNIYRKNDYEDILRFCNTNTKLIYIQPSKSMYLYHTNIRITDDSFTFNKELIYTTEEEWLDFHFNTFFSEDMKMWDGNNKWDTREKYALNIRPLSTRPMDTIPIDNIDDYFWISSESIWFDTESSIMQILDYLGLNIEKDRISHWRDIHREWHKIQIRCLYLSFNLDHILDCIVNNRSYRLIDLTFQEEVIIQHFLIYRYGLNLKTWGLEKFPENTAELFQILEPNIHIVPSLYSS
jgi:hypothetical protein